MNRILALLVVAAMLASLLRTRGASPPPAAAGEEGGAEAGPPRSPSAPAATGARVRFEIRAEVAPGGRGPPVELRLRAREEAQRPFDVTMGEREARQRFALEAALPVAAPELPLRVEIAGDDWCIPPGLTRFELARLDEPRQLGLERARAFEVAVVAERTGAPVAGASFIHESGVGLGRSALDGSARIVRPRGALARGAELVIVLAPGFLPAALEEAGGRPAAALPLRERSRAGTARGRVVDAEGEPVAGALVSARCEPAGAPPQEPAARALHRVLAASAVRELPALLQQTAADGAFELPIAWPGRWLVVARQRDHGRTSAELSGAGVSDAGHVETLELRFPPPFELRVVARHGGRPLAGCALELVQQEGDETTPVAAGVTGADGSRTLRGPATARLWLVARAEGLAPIVREVAADPRIGVDQELDLDGGRAVAFAIDGGEALEAGLHVVGWRDAASRLWLGEEPLGADGRVRLDHLPVGRRLELFVAAAGEPGLRLIELEVPPPEAGAQTSELDLGGLALPEER